MVLRTTILFITDVLSKVKPSPAKHATLQADSDNIDAMSTKGTRSMVIPSASLLSLVISAHFSVYVHDSLAFYPLPSYLYPLLPPLPSDIASSSTVYCSLMVRSGL